MKQEGVRAVLKYSMDLEWSREEIFPLLCPVREYEWIPVWRCDMIHCQSGRAELGCVFATDFEDGFGREVWVVSHYQPPERIAFVRTGSLRSTRYEIRLQEGRPTMLLWRQEVTSLTPAGDRLVRQYRTSGFEEMMRLLHRLLKHYLATGTMLSPASSGEPSPSRKGKRP